MDSRDPSSLVLASRPSDGAEETGVRQGRPTVPAGGLLGLSPAVVGTACCIVSAVGYTASNVCMRQLSALKADPTWATCNRELVTVVVVGPWLVAMAVRGMLPRPALRSLAILAVVGLAVQLGANLGLQWSYSIVGLAVAIPAVFALMITTSAGLGRVVLGERVTERTWAAMGLLLVALVMLSLATHTEQGPGTDQPITGPFWLALGIAAPCLAGAIFALLTVTIRHAVTGATPMSIVVFVTTLMGVVSLGPLSVGRLGWAGLAATPAEQLLWMAAAGVCNLIAFVAITKGLQLTTAVHANVLNASQVAMAAVAGLVWFDEPLSTWLVLGVCLTVAGIVLVDRPKEDEVLADQHA